MRALLSVWTFTLGTGRLLTAMLLAQSSPAKPQVSSSLRKTQDPTEQPIPQFEDVAQKAGLTVPHTSSPDKKYIVESMRQGGLRACLLSLTLAFGVSAIRATWQLGAQCNGEAKVSIERNGPNGTFAGEEQSVSGGVGLIDCDNDGKFDIITHRLRRQRALSQPGQLQV